MAGDFSPLTMEAAHGPREAPPALLLAMAIGLGTMDMPVPAVAEWEWLNWRFPGPVHAGDTIVARWTLTQKRPPAHGAPSAIVVWRVDVHRADGTLCAEGEVGAKIKRHPGGATHSVAKEPDGATSGAPGAGTRRRRRRRPGTNGHGIEPVAAPPPPAAVHPPKTTSQAAAPAKRRRRRRVPAATSASAAQHDGTAPKAAEVPAPAAVPAAPAPQRDASAGSKPGHSEGALGRVISRLRRS